jgi:hypothetical protein
MHLPLWQRKINEQNKSKQRSNSNVFGDREIRLNNKIQESVNFSNGV